MKKSQLESEEYTQPALLDDNGSKISANRRDFNGHQRRLARQLKRELREFCFKTEIYEEDDSHAHTLV